MFWCWLGRTFSRRNCEFLTLTCKMFRKSSAWKTSVQERVSGVDVQRDSMKDFPRNFRKFWHGVLPDGRAIGGGQGKLSRASHGQLTVSVQTDGVGARGGERGRPVCEGIHVTCDGVGRAAHLTQIVGREFHADVEVDACNVIRNHYTQFHYTIHNTQFTETIITIHRFPTRICRLFPKKFQRDCQKFDHNFQSKMSFRAQPVLHFENPLHENL